MLNTEFGLKRYIDNSIISPKDFPGADCIFNCGQTMYEGKTILLAAVRMRDGGVPCIHVAESDDGINFQIRPEPFIVQ